MSVHKNKSCAPYYMLITVVKVFCVCLSVCQQGCGKRAVLIFINLGGRVKHGPRKKLLNSGVDPNHGTDTQIIFHFI